MPSLDEYKLDEYGIIGDIIWKPIGIADFDGLYEVSSYGAVRSLHKKSCFYHKFLKASADIHGYLTYNLMNVYKKLKKVKAHRIVACTYIPNDNPLLEVDHINGDKLDNRVENLRWVLHKDNLNNPITKNRREKALAKHRMSASYMKERQIAIKKMAIERGIPVVCIETGEWFYSSGDASKIYGIQPVNVLKSCYRTNSKTKTTSFWRGKPVYHFRFATDEENKNNFPLCKEALLSEEIV